MIPSRSSLKIRLLSFGTGIVLLAAAVGTWSHYSRPKGAPLSRPHEVRIVAKQVPQTSLKPSANEIAYQPTENEESETHQFRVDLDPLKDFHQQLKKALLEQLQPSFPELRTALDTETPSIDPVRRPIVFHLLDSADKVPPEQRPAVLLAADFAAANVWCDVDKKADCDQLRRDFARYDLNLQGASLGGVYVYKHDLLWRVWRDFPATDWGEQAFVLLMEHGWDTSPTCEKGGDQSVEVINRGEDFLQNRPTSRQRAIVTLLLGDAYAVRWSVESSPTSNGVEDPKRLEDADAVRMKAIDYFQEVLRLAAESSLADYAKQVIPHLSARDILDLDNARFYCVYD